MNALINVGDVFKNHYGVHPEITVAAIVENQAVMYYKQFNGRVVSFVMHIDDDYVKVKS